MTSQEESVPNPELEAFIAQKIAEHKKLPKDKQWKTSWIEKEAGEAECSRIVRNHFLMEENSIEAPSSIHDFEELPFVS